MIGSMFKTIKEWWSILKEDCDWDYCCILQILEFKLNKMADRFEKDGICEGSIDKARDMREAANYCRLLIDDDFVDYDSLTKKYGSPELLKKDSLVVSFVDFRSEEKAKEYSLDFKRIVAEGDRLRQEALDSLCGILKNNLFGWWY